MIKKLLGFILLGIILFGTIFTFAGCSSEESTNRAKVEKTTRREITKNIDEKVSNIKADVVITGSIQGGEIVQDITYYINYKKSKLYVYDKSTFYPMCDCNNPLPSKTTISLYEYTVADEDLKELKEFLNAENGRVSDSVYTVKKGKITYGIKRTKKFERIIRNIVNI